VYGLTRTVNHPIDPKGLNVFLKIDPSSGIPIYRQIMDQIKHSIASGALRSGEQLPSVRQLSLDLKVNPTTVVKAYSELEHEGVIHTRRGMGTFVSEGRIEMAVKQKVEILSRLAERLVVEAVHLGVTSPRLREIFEDIIQRYFTGNGNGEQR